MQDIKEEYITCKRKSCIQEGRGMLSSRNGMFSTCRLCSVQGCDVGNDIIYSGQPCRGRQIRREKLGRQCV